VIVCPRCSKENQDHYKFCLGCGAELPRDAAHAPKSFTAPTPPAGRAPAPMAAPPMPAMPPMAAPPMPSFGGAPAMPSPAPGPAMAAPPMPSFGGPPMASPAPAPSFGGAPAMPAPAPAAPPMAAPPMPSFGGGPPMASPAPIAAPAASGDQLICPKCGTSNNRNFKFCGSCGHPMGASIPAPPPAAPMGAPAMAMSSGPQRGSLVLIRADGSEGDSFAMSETTIVGRETGGLFASDSYLSPRHATFTFGPGSLVVRDENSLNGVYMRIGVDQPIELVDRAIFRIGQEIIRFERLGVRPAQGGVELMGSPNTGLAGRICLITGRDTTGNCYGVPSAGLHLGRERGDILFPEDGYVSGLHCRIHEEGGRVFLTDVGSSNGTFVRVHGQTSIPSGSLLLMGQQLFRVEY
jgi:pSer/pThr/pTyr-binding forkhead associated (FHA) protein